MLVTHRSTPLGMRRHAGGRTVKIGPITMKFMTLVLLALAALFYLAQSSESATKRYRVFELEEQETKLDEEKAWLEQEALRLKSLGGLQTTAETLKLEPNQTQNQPKGN